MRFLILLIIVFVSSCAASKKTNLQIEKLERSQAAISSDQVKLYQRFEEVSNSLLILQDRLETLKLSVERKETPASKATIGKKPIASKKITAPKTEPVEEEEPFLFEGDAKAASLPSIQLNNEDLARMEREDAKKEPVPSKAAPEPAEVSDENPVAIRAYNSAYQRYQDGHYAEAIRSLDQFVKEFPDHSYADNAMFWIGESYFKNRDYKNAASYFSRVAKDFPTGNKVPDALLRAGACYLQLTKKQEAKQTFQRIIQLYPQSLAAKKAEEALGRM